MQDLRPIIAAPRGVADTTDSTRCILILKYLARSVLSLLFVVSCLCVDQLDTRNIFVYLAFLVDLWGHVYWTMNFLDMLEFAGVACYDMSQGKKKKNITSPLGHYFMKKIFSEHTNLCSSRTIYVIKPPLNFTRFFPFCAQLYGNSMLFSPFLLYC